MGMPADETALAVAADLVVRDFMCCRAGEEVLITADGASDGRVVAALLAAARVQQASVAVMTIPQLPLQGALADPYVPATLAAATKAADVWLDLTFPYLGGSGVHAAALQLGRVRHLLLGDLDAGGLARLFTGVSFDRLFALQGALDDLVAASVGRECRVTSPAGTDVSFTIGRPATVKRRHVDRSGSSTPPGSAVIYPEIESVRGTIVIEAVFHEFHTLLRSPITLTVDGPIRSITGDDQNRVVLERSLTRAGGGALGSIIHFSHGFHPAGRITGRSFVEDIRAAGCNAIGFGIPWWEPGGGENHPDGVVTMQSLWIGGRQIVRDARIVDPPELAALQAGLQ